MAIYGSESDPRGSRLPGWSSKPPAAPKKVFTAPVVNFAPSSPVYTPPPVNTGWGGGGGGGWGAPAGPSAAQIKADAAQVKANTEAKDRSRKENEATKALVDQQVGLSAAFGKQRDIKLSNIANMLKSGDANLLKGYSAALGGLLDTSKDNDRSESDSTFQNVANAMRERGDILTEIGNSGGGETDILRGQLAALRNYSANQNEVNRSFFDTLGSINRSITSLNTDTATSRYGMWSQSEADKEAAWANYYNQQADTWTQITNIENSNNNTATDSSEAYVKFQPNSGKKAAEFAGSSYKKVINSGLDSWEGKGSKEERKLASTNAAATVNLGGPMKRAEGATLRKW